MAQNGYWCRFASTVYGLLRLWSLRHPNVSTVIGLVPTIIKTWVGSFNAKDSGESVPSVASTRFRYSKLSGAMIPIVFIPILLSLSDSALAASLTDRAALDEVTTRLPPTAVGQTLQVCHSRYMPFHPAFGLTSNTPRKLTKSHASFCGSVCIAS